MPEWLLEMMRQSRRLAEDERDLEALQVMDAALDELEAGDGLPDIPLCRTVDRNRAWLLAHVGRAQEAVEIAEQVFNEEPTPLSRATLGVALAAAGEPAQALELLTHLVLAATGDPWNASAVLHWRGHALAALGQMADAKANWTASAERHPNGRYARMSERRIRGAGAPYRS